MSRFLYLVILLNVSFSTFCQVEDYRFWITKMSGGNGYGKISTVNTDGSNYHDGVVFKGALEGSNPKPGFLSASDGKIYGTTSDGGMFDRGVIFYMNPDGSSYTVLYHFTIAGAQPTGSLIEGSNGKLYGVCKGISSYPGIVFSLDRNTRNFEVIHEFDVDSDGKIPTSITLVSNGMLYGVCEQTGPASNAGSIFRIDLANNVFEKLTDTHGLSPGPLIEGSDGLLYGIAPQGGTTSSGEIHRINLDGSGYTTLFDLSSVGGISPSSSIMEGPDGFLYGTCRVGVEALIFKVQKDASDFAALHTFEESSWIAPSSGLMLASDGLLYGYAKGVFSGIQSLYKINTDGSGFEQLNNTPDNFYMLTVPVQVADGSFLFASIIDGQARNGRILKRTPGGTLTVIKQFAETQDHPYQILHSRSNEIYGIHRNGGMEGYGGVFRLTKDGTDLVSTIFENSSNDGIFSYNLTEDDEGNFYGYTGGNVISISKLSPDGNRTTIFQFDNSTSSNTAELILASNSRLYGITRGGGSYEKGTLFSLKTDGSGFTTEHSFTENTIPRQPIHFESDGYLYGVINGGVNNKGSIFKFHMATKIFETIFDFPANIGTLLFGYVKLMKGSDKMIYVTATSGGTGQGAIFKVAMDGSGFQEVRTFSSADNAAWLPLRLIEGPDSQLYGITALGGEQNTGVLFRMSKDGNDYQPVFELPEELELRFLAEVDLNLIPKIPHNITFSLPSHTLQVGQEPIALNATSDAGFPITFTSSDPAVAKIEASTLSILKTGEVTISARQTANDFYASGIVTQALTIIKGDQSLTFDTIEAKTAGDVVFELTATSSAGLPVSYSTTDDNISLSGNEVTIVSAGRATIVAQQQGDENYNDAPVVQQSFCINPPKPAIMNERISATEVMLTSSNEGGNQWYFNGTEITDATSKTLTVTADGTYTIKTTIETCASSLSDEFLTIVTGVEILPDDHIATYPNPVRQHLVVEQKNIPRTHATIDIIDSSGKVLIQRTTKSSREVFDLSSYGSGLYHVHVQCDGKFFVRRILRN